MRFATVDSCAAAVLALTLAPGASAAAPRAITGKLSKPGYTVLAIGASGETRVAVVKGTAFRLRPPASRVTLHLRAPDGRYAGPVIIGTRSHGTRAIVGVRAGAHLGRVVVRAAKGYARVERAPRNGPDIQRLARARKGVPIGAGNVGRVRSAADGAMGLGRDEDLDGVPGVLDIDDDGDLILDNVDRRRRAAHAAVITDTFLLQTELAAVLDTTANANTGLDAEEMNAALAANGRLGMGILPGDSPELDCGQPQSRTDPTVGGLVYCSAGGTGRLFVPGVTPQQQLRFPDDGFDPDGDGFGTMTPSSSESAPGSGQLVMVLNHGATTEQIGTGDLLIQRVVRDGVESQFPATLQYIFATVPALVSYDDGHGNSATVDYSADRGPGTPGSRENGFPVTAGPDGDVVLTLTYWRPQRTPIGTEAGPWTDIGRLNYTTGIQELGATGCPQDAYGESDGDLGLLEPADVFPANYAGVKDLIGDRPADPNNTFTFSVNLMRCLGALSFAPGETRNLSLAAVTPNGTDGATQGVSFTRR